MEIRTLDCISTGEFDIAIRVDKREVYQYVSAAELARTIRDMLAEKIAQKLFESVEPKLIDLIKGDQDGQG